VKHISVHPTGKLALTLGDDMTIRTWNLINGRQAYATNLKNKEKLGGISDYVEWSPDGDFFALSGAKTIEVWSIDTGLIVRSQECAARPTGICWISNEELIVGMDNGQLMAFNLSDLEVAHFS
jgi:protein MAK11